MYGLLVCLVAVLGTCASSASIRLPAGNPSSGDLWSPLTPFTHPDFWVSIEFDDAADSPSGVQLMTSLLVQTYKYWKDMQGSAPITQRKEARVQPFMEFVHTVQPSLLPGAPPLKPLKIGLAYPSLLYGALHHPTGNITARIFDAHNYQKGQNQFGTVNILNSPQAGVTKSELQLSQDIQSVLPANNSRIRLVTPPHKGRFVWP